MWETVLEGHSLYKTSFIRHKLVFSTLDSAPQCSVGFIQVLYGWQPKLRKWYQNMIQFDIILNG